MRSLTTIILLFVTSLLWGQSPKDLKPVPGKVYALEVQQQVFPSFTPFQEAMEASRLETIEEVKSASWGLVPDPEVLGDILKQRPAWMDVRLPKPDGSVLVLRVYQARLGTEDFEIRFSDGTVVKEVPGVHYRGIVHGDYQSLVALSFFEDHARGFVSDQSGNWVLGPFEPRQERDIHIFYNDRTLAHLNPFQCHVEDRMPGPGEDFDTHDYGQRAPGDCVRIWWEVDYDITQNKGGGAGASTWMTGMTNEVYTLYDNELMELYTSVMNIWTGPSPYSGNSSSARLGSFQSNNGVLDGDLAHYVNLTSQYGGIAAGFSGICNANYDASMCYSGLTSSYNNVPTYSWTIMVCTHEMGHLLGSRHTHACVWNGNNTAIDGCAGFVEGGCSLPGQPPGGGTIMSYCHLNVGINFTLGFGPQPGNVIRNTVNNANCLDGCGDPQDPCTFSLNCPVNVTVQCGPNPPPAQTGNPVVNILTGNCSPTISYTDNNNGLNGCNGTGFFIRTFTATDGNYSATCNQTITKIDNTPPVINGVPANTTINCNSPIPPVPPVSATDNCGSATLTFQETSTQGGSCGYTITRTWTATDACNNATSRSQVITVVDSTPPNAQCKGHTVYLNNNGQAVVTAQDIDNMSSDNCSAITLTVNPSQLTCAQLGNTIVTLTVTDACNNVATCTATVSVIDAIPPKVTCLNMEVEIDASGAPVTISPQDVNNGSSDNCGIVEYMLSQETFDCSHLGQNSVKLSAIDASGNAGQCTAKVTVRDLIPPTFTYVPEDMTVYCVEPGWEDIPSMYDNCGDVGFLMDETQHYWADGPEGSYRVNRRWTAIDKAGNSAEAEQWISVLSQGDLVVLCTPDVVTAASKAPVQAWWQDPQVSDVCLGNFPMTRIEGPEQGSYFNPGTRTRIAYEFINDFGVRYQCAFHVIVPGLGQDYRVLINAAEVECEDYRLRRCTVQNLPETSSTFDWKPRGDKNALPFAQMGDAVLEVFADGTARLQGSWDKIGGVPGGWVADIHLYHRRNAQGWQAVSGKTNNPLGADTSLWDYFEIDPSRSFLIGNGVYGGKVYQVRSSIIWAGHGMQVGNGANGVTTTPGAWLSVATYDPLGKLQGQGEFRFVINCSNTPQILQAGDLISLDGQAYTGAWSNGTAGESLGAVAPGTYTVSVTLPSGQVNTHTFVLAAPGGCVNLWQDACREKNMALKTKPTQGSTWQGAVAARAVDGQTDGDWANGTVSSTLQGWQNFWQTELPDNYTVSSVRLWPRTDCCHDQLNDHYIFVSPNPIPDMAPELLLRTPGIRAIVHKGRMNTEWETPVEATGRYVKVQLQGAGQLQLAEVEVLVCQPDRLDPPSRYEPEVYGVGNRPPKGLGMPGVSIWPNPGTDLMLVDIDPAGTTAHLVVVRNMQGQEIWRQPLSTDDIIRVQLPVHDWPDGPYILTVDTSDGPVSERLAVQR